MNRKPQTSKRVARVMGNPKPLYVSLVNQGANQRAFHDTKRAHKESVHMPKSNGTAKIHRMTFDKAEFPDAKTVEDYLTVKGYTDFTVEEGETEFSVTDHPAEAFAGEIRAVDNPTTKGVTMHVGHLKAEDDGAGDEGKEAKGSLCSKCNSAEHEGDCADKKGDPGDDKPKDPDPAPADPAPAPAPEPEAKTKTRRRSRSSVMNPGGMTITRLSADWEAFADAFAPAVDTSKKSLADTIIDYTGGMPPGMWVLMDAYMTEMRRLFVAGEVTPAAITALNAELTVAVVAMSTALAAIAEQSTAKSAADAPGALDSLLGAVFAMPKAEAAPDMTSTLKSMQDALDALVKDVKATKASAGEAFAALLLSGAPAGATEEVETPTLPGRKSSDDTDPEDEQGEEKLKEDEETARRTAKRLGADY